MYSHVIKLSAVFVVLLFVAVSPRAHAQSVSSVVERMDTIIEEMEALRAEFARLAASINPTTATVAAPTPAVQGAATSNTLTMDLSFGETNEDIERIQRLLATDPAIYDHPYVTGYFGPKTEEAIRNFQSRFGLEPVGIIGPATTALLEVFFASYPDENYPAGVLENKPATPTVQGASTSVTPSTPTPTAPVSSSVSSPADEINVQIDGDEALIEIIYENGNRKGLIADTDDEDEIVEFIARKTVLTIRQVEAVIDIEDDNRRSRRDDDDYDEDDADDALDAADEAIEDAEEEIEEADEAGDDVDWAEDTLAEAEEKLEDAEREFEDEDWDKAVELAEEAEELAKDAEDRIDEEEDDDDNDDKGDSDEIETIEAEVDDEDETRVTVEYENDDDYEFEVEEDRKERIIKEIADELDIDEDDVEDEIEFDWGDIDSVDAIYEDDRVRVEIEFETGVDMRLILDDDLDEDDVIEEVADELDVRDGVIEEIINFEYDD